MRKLLLIIAIATMTVVANAQNKVTNAKSTPEMVYYYTDFSVVRMKDTARKQDVYVPFLGENTTLNMEPMKDDEGNIISFEVPIAAFNYITSQGWELWLHDDHYNIIQRWFVRKKVTKQEFMRLTKEEMKLTKTIERIPSAVEELQRMVK